MTYKTLSTEDLALLPCAESDFHRIRERNNIYVDKTALIYKLAITTQKFFFSRPRRFGKTLLLSTFESLFKYGLRDFKGLAIEKLWTDKKTYPVIRLDFSDCTDFDDEDEFKEFFDEMLLKAVSNSGLVLPKTDPDLGLKTVLSRFDYLLEHAQPPLPVLLIDEYDAPLNDCLKNPELHFKVRVFIAS